MKLYFAYIRVSTVKQGEHGSSLQEQRDAITSFASRNNFRVVRWFEERETAAKSGRAEFSSMLAALRNGDASGVIFHKIDRSARNLRDWSTIQDLAEQGVDVRFTQESINLGSNEGRLTGDFLAVISSHYIRNLREEVKKGIRGRLKQGLYPLAAPLGYLDQGGGKAKIPDPEKAPFVREAFTLYGSGLALRDLSHELYQRGFRSKYGKKVTAARLASLLRNPFYIGIIRMAQSGDHYAGVHAPLIAKDQFDRVQLLMNGKLNARVVKHEFSFRRTIVCEHCKMHLTGERQKGHVYYRCHTPGCLTRSIKEEAVEEVLLAALTPLGLSSEDRIDLKERCAAYIHELQESRGAYEEAISFKLANLETRLSALMDLFLDGEIDKALFQEKKLKLLLERKDLQERGLQIESARHVAAEDIENFFERVDSLLLSYKMGNPSEKHEILKAVTSNLTADGKNVVVKLRSPFEEVANLSFLTTGGPVRNRLRTRTQKIFDLLVAHYTGDQVEEDQRDLPLAA